MSAKRNKLLWKYAVMRSKTPEGVDKLYKALKKNNRLFKIEEIKQEMEAANGIR